MIKKGDGRKSEGTVFGAHIGAVHMEISGNRELILEGSRGILEYNDGSVRINAGKYIVALRGRGLHIVSMTESDLVINGFITLIEYII